MLSTGIRQQHRSMDSSVRGPVPGQPQRMHGATAKVQVTEAVEGLRRVTSVVVGTVKVLQVTEAVEELKRATSVVAEGKRAL